MSERAVLVQGEASASLFAELDSRDAAVWLQESFSDALGPGATARVLGLPWSIVLCESSDKALIEALETSESPDSPLVRRRGIVHIVDTNPSDVSLPRRSLPVFLLNGRTPTRRGGLASVTRRLTMIEELDRRAVRHVVLLAGPELIMPEELAGLWADGFRTLITVVSDAPDVREKLADWVDKVLSPPVGLIPVAPSEFVEDLVSRYTESRDDRLILRLRDATGALHRLDVTGLDDPEHPLLGRYELLTENLLLPLLPSDLRAEEVEGFFKDPRSSWRPFAAGMPWQRAHEARIALMHALRRLDREGAEANRLFYVSAETGAGATTFVRDLAWSFASEGYPVLLAGPAPFSPNGVELASYMLRSLEAATNAGIGEDTRLYQAPWVIVFDRTHWDGHEDELISFSRELEKSGRRACILFVVGPYLPIAVYDSRFECLTTLTHQVTMEDALDLGRHLNRFLQQGATRSEADWRNFFDRSVVGHSNGIAAFWIALSFWLQRQFDLNETIQAWLYRQYRQKVVDPVLQRAIIDIAAMSAEHQALPEDILPASADWPTAEKLADLQSELGALGIVRLAGDGGRYWALIHDVLGRLLLNALFYDHAARVAAGFEHATNAEHLRLLALARIAGLPALARNDLREVANAFATSIFKIDPDHGRAVFAPFWREALAALDGMPRAFRTTSRTFLHHAAVSRRRIAKDHDSFPISDDERADLLARAIQDIEAALNIAPEPGGDPDLNLLNSLAHAYLDLAEVEVQRGAPAARVEELRDKAREATRRAYRLNPDNSFVIETYARDLLSGARSDPQVAAGNAIEVLGIVYTSMQRSSAEPRRFALGRLADAAVEILLEVAGEASEAAEPQSESDAIVAALKALVEGVARFDGMQLSDYPSDNRIHAAERLACQVLLGNPQAVRLRYLLTCLDRPFDFALQLELLESLEGGAGSFTPQMSLELAVLLHQRDRHHEAARKFRELRQLWRQEEHYVEIPSRLRWLLVRDKTDRRQVHARVSINGEGRYYANVRELQDGDVVFRPQEFGQQRLRAGMVVNGFISFGHNGPFLRPLTAT
jgi:tetratricopeptide (TPR) repeat protein